MTTFHPIARAKRSTPASFLLWLALTSALSVSGLARGAVLDGISFHLADHRGQPFDHARLAGHWSVLFFGYTHCPDVCPLGLSRLAGGLRRLGELARQVNPYFITVDPERDTPARLASYVKAFHPRLVGVSGPLAELRALTGPLGVKFLVAKIGDEVIVQHSSQMIILAPDGRVAARLAHTSSPEKIAGALRRLLAR